MDIYDSTTAQTVIDNLGNSTVDVSASIHRLTVMTGSGAFLLGHSFRLLTSITQPEVVMLSAESPTRQEKCSAHCNGTTSRSTWVVRSKFSMP